MDCHHALLSIFGTSMRIPTISTVDSVSYRPQPKQSDAGYFINSQVDGVSGRFGSEYANRLDILKRRINDCFC